MDSILCVQMCMLGFCLQDKYPVTLLRNLYRSIIIDLKAGDRLNYVDKPTWDCLIILFLFY